MRSPPPRPAPAATGVATRDASPKSDAKRSSSGGQVVASAEPATAAMSTRVSSTTASPSRASSATSSAGDERSMSAARIERGTCPAPRRAHAALLDQAAHAAGGLGLEHLPGRRGHAAGHHQLGGPIADDLADRDPGSGTSSGRSPGRRAISRKPRTEPSSARVPSQARRQPQQRQVEGGVDVEPRPRRRAEVAPLPARVVERVAARRCRSRTSSSAARARSRSPATTNASALKRLLATTSPGIGESRASSPSSSSERQGPRAGVADRVDRCRVAERPPGRRRRTSVPSGTTRRRAAPRTAAAPPPRRAGRAGATARPPAVAGPRPPRRRASRTAGPSAGVATRTSGAGRSGIRRCRRAASVSSRPCSCSRCMQSWMPRKRSHSPQRRCPISGWSIPQRCRSCPAMRAADSRIARARLVEEDEELLAGRVRPARDRRGDDRRPLLRPLAAGVERRPRPEEAARGGRVREGLGDVPVLLAAGGAEQRARASPAGRARARRRRTSCWARIRGVSPSWTRSRSSRRSAFSPAERVVERAPAGDDVGGVRLDGREPGRHPPAFTCRRVRGARSAPPAGRRPWLRRPPPRPGRACRTRPAP